MLDVYKLREEKQDKQDPGKYNGTENEWREMGSRN